MANNASGPRRPERWRRWLLVLAGSTALLVVGFLVASAVRGDGNGYTQGIGKKRCSPQEPRTSLCPHAKTFNVKGYITHGDAYSCLEFADQADAQAVLRADPSDPNHLDSNHDGVACPALAPPKDTTPVQAVVTGFRCDRYSPRSARCPQPWRRFDPADSVQSQVDEYDCSDYASQADAQAVLRYEPEDPNRLDSDHDGIACPQLHGPKDLQRVTVDSPSTN